MPWLGDDLEAGLEKSCAAAIRQLARPLEAPFRKHRQCRFEPCEERCGDPVLLEASCALPRHEGPVGLVGRLREVAWTAHAERLRVAHVERAGRRRPAEPLLARHGVVVVRLCIDRDRADRLRAVDEERHIQRRLQFRKRYGMSLDPEDVGHRDEPRSRPDLGEDRVECLGGGPVPHFRHPNVCPRRMERTEQPEVLGVGRDDLVVRPETEPAEHDAAALGGGRRQRHTLRVHADLGRDDPAQALPRTHDRLEGLHSAAGPELRLRGFDHRVVGRAGHRPDRARVQVRVAVEYGKGGARFLERHATRASTGA